MRAGRPVITTTAPSRNPSGRGRDGPQRVTLVDAQGPDLPDVLAGLQLQVVAVGELPQRCAELLERCTRVAQLTGVHADRPALVLDPRTFEPEPGQQPGQLLLHVHDPVGGGRQVEPVTVGVPALHAVLTEHRHRPQTGGLAEPAESDGGARGPARDDDHRAQHRAQSRQRGHGSRIGVGVLGVVDDRGQRAVEVQREHRLLGSIHHRSHRVDTRVRHRSRATHGRSLADTGRSTQPRFLPESERSLPGNRAMVTGMRDTRTEQFGVGRR